MIPEDRRRLIIDELSAKGYVSVDEFAQLLYVSVPTVRRDLKQLEQEGILRRTHGGASYLNTEIQGHTFAYRNQENMEAKRKIGAVAASYLDEGNVAFLDSSSTCLGLIKNIPKDMELHVITNGIPVVHALADHPNVTIEMTGGTFDRKHDSVFDIETVEYIKRRHATVSFFSCTGIHPAMGPCSINSIDAAQKRAMSERSDLTVFLVDHTKFSQTAACKIIDFDQIDVLITDRPLSRDMQEVCQKHEIIVKVPRCDHD